MEESHTSDKKIVEMIQERLDYLRHRTDFFDTLFKGIKGYAVIAADFDGNIIAYNEGARLIYGYTPEEVIGRKNFDEFLPKDFVEAGGLGGIVDNLLDKGGYSYEGEKIRKDGERFPARVILMLTKSVEGNIIGFIEASEDLTERKRWEAEIKKLNEELEEKVILRTAQLEESMEHFRILTDTANDAIICLRSPGKIYLWNKKAEEMFGYRNQEAINKDLQGLIVPEKYHEKLKEGLKRFFERGTGPIIGKTIELSGLHKDGKEFPIELSVSAIKIRGEWHATGIIRDITERKKAEEKLRERLEELERFKKATIQRELRMKELRDRLEEFEKKEGRKQ